MSARQFLSKEVLAFRAAHIQKELTFNMKCLFSCCELVRQSLRTQKEWTGSTNTRLMKCLDEISTIFFVSEEPQHYQRRDNVSCDDGAAAGSFAANDNRVIKKNLVDAILNDETADDAADETADAAGDDEEDEVAYRISMKSVADAFSPSLEADHIRLQKMIDERRERLRNHVETVQPPSPKFRVTSGDPSEKVHAVEKTVALPPNSSEEAWEEAKNAAGITNEEIYNRANEALLESLTEGTPAHAKNYKPLDCGETAPPITRMSKFNSATQQKIYYEIHCKAIGNIHAIYGQNLPKDRAEALYSRESDRLLQDFLANKITVPSATDRADIVC